MSGPKNSQKESPQAIRVDLAGRLRACARKIEKAIISRIQEVSEPDEDGDPAYVVGLQRTVAEVFSFGLESIEKGGKSFVPIPVETARQARRAAREGVRLDTVMRRYTVGSKVLEQFIMAEAGGIPRQVLCQVLSDLGPHVDRLMESVAAEFRDEREQIKRSSIEKDAERIVHLLEGDIIVPPTDLDYDFNVWHVGMILVGANAEKSACAFADHLGYRSLSVARDHGTTWAWLGSRQRPAPANFERFLSDNTPTAMSVAVGEPRKTLEGWRQTHYEAKVALGVMLYRAKAVTRCRDVILESAVMRDQRLAMSLIETYLVPLDGRGSSGEVLRGTLRAYFKANQSIASTAITLGVARHTVKRRLRKVEEKLGQTLDACNAQLQVALSAEELIPSSVGGMQR